MEDFKIVNAEQLDSDLKSIAESIRAKSGSSEQLSFPDGFKEKIDNIQEGYWSEQDVFDFFENRSTVSNLKIPDNLTTIPDYAFYHCASLEITDLPNSAKSIGDSAFMGCGKLSVKKLPDTLNYIGQSAFRRTGIAISNLPPNLKSIGNYAFLNADTLSVSKIPSTVVTLGTRIFEGCTGLTDITFEGTPDAIGAGIFNGCTNLLTINVPWSESDSINTNAPWGAENATINYNYAPDESEE